MPAKLGIESLLPFSPQKQVQPGISVIGVYIFPSQASLENTCIQMFFDMPAFYHLRNIVLINIFYFIAQIALINAIE